MRRTIAIVVPAVAAILALGVAAPAAHAGTIDQDTADFFGASEEAIDGQDSVAQTFTAGRSGLLDRVDLALFIAPDVITRPLTVQIREIDGDGAPGRTVLASADVTPTSVPHEDWTPVSFSSPAAVTAGTSYAIVAYMLYPGFAVFPEPPFRERWLWEAPSAAYAGGSTFLTRTSPPEGWSGGPLAGDRAFRTYVAPAQADLSVRIAGPATAPESYVAYLLTARNGGPNAAANVVLRYRLPAGLEYQSFAAGQGGCTPPPGKGVMTVTCALGQLPAGGSASVAFGLKVLKRAQLENTATVSSDTGDPGSSNNSASLTTQITR